MRPADGVPRALVLCGQPGRARAQPTGTLWATVQFFAFSPFHLLAGAFRALVAPAVS